MLAFKIGGYLLLNLLFVHFAKAEDVENDDDDKDYYKFLYDSMKINDEIRRAPKLLPLQRNKVVGSPVKLEDSVQLPGGYFPLPGRTTYGDYWPLMPFVNQYHAAATYDPSRSRHVGGDLLIPVPFWNNFLDMSGHYIERVQDYWVKVGYVNSPVNMMGLRPEQLKQLMSDPALHWNKQLHPRLPIAAIPRDYVPVSCKPPMCNPYQASIGVGVEANYKVEDGFEGELDLPIPLSKDIAYRLPVSGNIHFDKDDTSVSYGQHLAPIDPMSEVLNIPRPESHPNEKL
ncbi:unnamed protein product [Caenorhabditis auriculariae]|uniref:Uncharacterized protein n=1 Tax=Caenorhabditis auriculariae TaxID=2777116 RepID=A0A8S1GQM3_9PELO|nr:unnamed protein product [Caenorhabditis auriculariae]